MTDNKQLIGLIFSEMAQGNTRPLIESMSDDVRWTVTGTTPWSGTFEGKRAVMDHLFAPLRARIRGRIKTIAHRMIAEGEYVVVEARGDNTTNEGILYNNRYCFVFRFESGKMTEIIEYMDTQLVERVLSAPS